MPRALASLTLSFGLVSIPVRLYNATEPAPGVRFRLLTPEGRRIRQRYVEEVLPAIVDVAPTHHAPPQPTAPAPAPPEDAAAPTAVAPTRPARGSAPTSAAARVERAAPAFVREEPADEEPAPPAVARERLVKGYEFEKGRFVTFTPEELEALASPRRDTIDIVAFVPAHAVDPVYHGKAYYLAPDRRGAKPYALLLEALRQSERSAIAKWAWRGKETIAEVRPAGGGLALQQLHYADEVRSIDDLHIELEPVGREELALALQLVEQNAEPRFDAQRWVNEEQARIRAAIEQKVAGERIVETEPPRAGESAQVIDLMQALRASLRRGLDDERAAAGSKAVDEPPARKPAHRATPSHDKPARGAARGDVTPAPGPGAKRRSGR